MTYTVKGRRPAQQDTHQGTQMTYQQGAPDTSHLRPNFEGIGEDEDPDAYDRMKDRRRGG
jgi:hypothetical protein